MKAHHIALLLLVVLLAQKKLGAQAMPILPYLPAPLVSDGLVAYFPLNRTALDYSHEENHGRIKGGVTPFPDRWGRACGAMYFDGVDGQIFIPDNRSLKHKYEKLTICSWFRVDKDSPLSGLSWVMSKAKNPNQHKEQLGDKKVLAKQDAKQGQHELFFFDDWHFYTLTFEDGQAKNYIDGEQVLTYPHYNPLLMSPLPLKLGSDAPKQKGFFKGALDDIRIYNRALEAKEILTLYADKQERGLNLPCSEENLVDSAGHELDFQHNVKVNSDKITVYLYDHGRPDGDIVSVNVNGQWLVEKHKLKRKRKNIDLTEHFTTYLFPNQVNVLYSKAWNLGKNPPNTLTVEIHDGVNHPKRIILNSKIGKSGAIRINCVL